METTRRRNHDSLNTHRDSARSASIMAETVKRYEVFINFRGKDTRASFTSHLYASLQNAGINAFRDNDSLKRGYHISTSLMRAIEQSQISVIVFSRNYADSRWCLDELVKIMECWRTIGQMVLPVFYGVDPSEVRHQKGEFGEGFQSLLNRISQEEIEDKLLKWRGALHEAADLAGFVVLNSRNESEDIKDIVKKVTCLLDKADLFVADNPVGVKSRVQDMIQLLDIQTSNNNVLILGMWGMGGSGKTTIAKAIYNEIGRNFDGRSFLANVREVWEQTAGKVHLQEQILFDIFKGTATKIQSIDSGKVILKDRLRHKKVLIILDDVNELEQLDALCGSYKWFGKDSRIIITTRDMHILRGSGVENVYTMKEMDEAESIELFSWHAFKQVSPKKDFAEISGKVVEYSGRLPLALEVLGRYLFGRQATEWKCILAKLKTVPNDKVQNTLKISYDGLDDYQKALFLKIACFFIGKDRNDVIHILNDCELFPECGISVLVEQSLVTVDDKNRLGMHDLLRDMGRKIYCDTSRNKPEEHSRLQFPEDVLDVLSAQTGTNAVEGLTLKSPSDDAECFSASFEKMDRRRLLQLADVQLDVDFEHLSSKLRWLSWSGFPLRSIPTNFYPGNLVSLELENSKLELVWEEIQTQRMEQLKILNLSHSHHLTRCPDFSNMPNLEKLVLKDCPLLFEVSPSIGDLSEIRLIDLEDCVSLRSLPRSIYKLKSLKNLNLSGCVKIVKLEEYLEQITRVPFSMTMENLTILNLSHSHCLTHTPEFSYMPNLEKLVLKDCPMLSEVSPSIGHLKKILWIDLRDCISLCSLPRSIYKLNTVRSLNITGCLNIGNLVEDLDQMESSTATRSQVSNVTASTLIQMGMNCQVANILKEIILQNMDVNGSCCGILPGDSYPNWYTFKSEGSSVTFEVPQVEGRNLKSMMCIVDISTSDNTTSDGLRNMLVENYTKATIQVYKREALVSFEDDEWKRVLSTIEPGNKVEVVFVFENDFLVKNTTVYLVYEEPTDKKKNIMKKNSMGKNKFLWYLQIFVLATIVLLFWLKFLGFIRGKYL